MTRKCHNLCPKSTHSTARKRKIIIPTCFQTSSRTNVYMLIGRITNGRQVIVFKKISSVDCINKQIYWFLRTFASVCIFNIQENWLTFKHLSLPAKHFNMHNINFDFQQYVLHNFNFDNWRTKLRSVRTNSNYNPLEKSTVRTNTWYLRRLSGAFCFILIIYDL